MLLRRTLMHGTMDYRSCCIQGSTSLLIQPVVAHRHGRGNVGEVGIQLQWVLTCLGGWDTVTMGSDQVWAVGVQSRRVLTRFGWLGYSHDEL